VKVCKCIWCNNPVFGGGFCKYHQYKRLPDIKEEYVKQQTKRKAIKPRSKKMVEKMALYNQLKDKALTEAREKGPVRCFACNKERKGFVDWHHTEGRDEYLLETTKMVFMHRQHHNDIHNLSVIHLMKKSWYNIYLQNLKFFNPELYEREIEKRNKL